MFDLDHKFFKPLGVRIAVTAITGGWALFEFYSGATLWGIMFAAMAIWCAWSFFNGQYGKNDTDQ